MTEPEWTHLLQVIDRYKDARKGWYQHRLARQEEQLEHQDVLIRWQAGRIRELERLLRGQELNARWQ